MPKKRTPRIRHLETNRVSKPRCLHCGGTLEETKRTHKEIAFRQDNQKLAELPSRELIGQEKRTREGVMCKMCRKSFRDIEYLSLHFSLLPQCLQYYEQEGKVRCLAGRMVLDGTLSIKKPYGCKTYRIHAIQIDGKITAHLAEFETKEACETWISKLPALQKKVP